MKINVQVAYAEQIEDVEDQPVFMWNKGSKDKMKAEHFVVDGREW